MSIIYTKGCAVKKAIEVFKEKNDVWIPHIVNDCGFFNSGFVKAIKLQWPYKTGSPEYIYRNSPKVLGENTYSKVEENNNHDIIVVNMCAQTGISTKSVGLKQFHNDKPIRYCSLMLCMDHMVNYAKALKIKPIIVAPKFGSLRAGGNWDFIEELIEEIWCPSFEVIVCEY